MRPSTRRLAHLPHRPAGDADLSSRVRFTARRLPAKDAAAFVKQSIIRAPNRFEARVTLRAAAGEIASRVPAHWGTIHPLDAHTCEYRTGDDDLGWLCASRCSASTSRCTSRSSWSTICGRWPNGSSAPPVRSR